MIVKLLTEHHLEFLSLIGGCRGWSESHLSKCQIDGNLMPRLNYFTPFFFAVPAEADSADNGFGEFLSSPPASQTEQLGTGLANDTNLSTSQSSMNPVTMTTTSQNTPLQQTHIPQPKEEKKG